MTLATYPTPLAPDLTPDVSTLDAFDIIKQRRGWTPEFINHIEACPTDTLNNLDSAVALLHQHISARGEITILTDFDMDGVSSGLLTYAGLAELGATVHLVVPDYHGSRDMEPEDVQQALSLYPRTTLIITCDEATNSIAGITYARNRGVDMLITDHHQQLNECPATVLLNPNATGSTYSQPEICGAQVAYHLICAYTTAYRPDAMPQISPLRMFAGIGALADVMPLTGQTRHLIRQALPLIGLAIPTIPLNRWGSWDHHRVEAVEPAESMLCQIIAATTHSTQMKNLFYGFSVLMQQFVAARKLRSLDDINVGFLGFTLAPTFNATRRVGGDMADAFYIFAPDAVRAMHPNYAKTRAQAAQQLINNNELRKRMTADALTTIDDSTHGNVVYYSDAPAGILGLLATRLCNATNMPALVLNPETLNGSARSPEWLPLISTTADLPGVRMAGHEHACGAMVDNHEVAEVLIKRIHEIKNTLPAEALAPAHPDIVFSDMRSATDAAVLNHLDFYMDADLPLPVLDDVLVLVDNIHRMGPFGHGFEYPSISVRVPIADCEVAPLSNGKHLKITTPTGLECLWWNTPVTAHAFTKLGINMEVEVELGISEFNNILRSQGIVRTMRVDGRTIQ